MVTDDYISRLEHDLAIFKTLNIPVMDKLVKSGKVTDLEASAFDIAKILYADCTILLSEVKKIKETLDSFKKIAENN